MRTCPYCGKECPDELEFCPIDERALTDNKIQADNPKRLKTGSASARRGIKIIAAMLAYIPMVVLLCFSQKSIPELVVKVCVVFDLPAISVLSLIQPDRQQSPSIFIIFALLFLWSSVMARIFWQIAGTLQGESGPETSRGQYDWAAFRVRFVIGFVIGFLSGWRFVRDSQSMKTLTAASVVAGLAGGFLYGISKPPDFWSRT